MGIIATSVKLLIAAGVTGDALVTAIEELEESQKKNKSSAAIRQQRYRDRNALRNVSNKHNNVTLDSAHIENAGAPDSLFLPSEVVKKESKKESKITGSRFALTQIPDDWISVCREKRPDLDPFETFDAFRDWWIAQPGGKGVKLDWPATWRTWLRNQKISGKINGSRAYDKPNKHTAAIDAVSEALADHRAARGG